MLSFWQGEGVNRYHEQLGLIISLMSKSQAHRIYSLADLDRRIYPAIRHRQLLFAYDHYMRIVGCFTWANLTNYVAGQLLSGVTLHESEWSEGALLTIVDFIAPFGHAIDIASYIRERLFLDRNVIYSMPRPGHPRRITAWRRFRTDDRATPGQMVVPPL